MTDNASLFLFPTQPAFSGRIALAIVHRNLWRAECRNREWIVGHPEVIHPDVKSANRGSGRESVHATIRAAPYGAAGHPQFWELRLAQMMADAHGGTAVRFDPAAREPGVVY